MTRPGQLLPAIEAIYAAGLDETLWPNALAAVTGVIGGVGTALELIDRKTCRHREFHAFGLAPAGQLDYLRHYYALNPRFPAAIRQRAGELSLDYLFTDEGGMDRSPFYAEFLGPQDLRYTIGGILATSRDTFGVVAVQRSPRQGHADRGEITLMAQLSPHVGRAMETATRLKRADRAGRSLESALDCLADGAVLIAADGAVTWANRAAEAIVGSADGIAINRDGLSFADAGARREFAAGVAALLRLRSGDAASGGGRDLIAAREGGRPPYVVSIRPLDCDGRHERFVDGAVGIVFIQDLLRRNHVEAQLLRDVFGLTEAEASLARALHEGVTPRDHALARAVSVNTVYTHLRRIKEKTGCHRMPELIRRLNDLQGSVEAGNPNPARRKPLARP